MNTETPHTKTDKPLVPQLRFDEFEGEWKQDSLNKIAKVNPRTRELPNQFIYIDLESVTKGILVKEETVFVDEAPSRAQRVLDKGDILYQTVRPYQKNNYFFNKDGDYVASTGYAQIKAKYDSKYLFQFLHNEKFVNIVNRWSTGTSYPAISPSELVKIKIAFPTLPEQQKIAGFLTAVDTKIQHLTKKKELLEQYKKGVMQQLFSKQLRFKQPDGSDYPDWEEKKLGDIGKVKMCKRIFSNQTSESGDIPFFKIGTFGKEADAYITNDLYLEFKNKYSFPKIGDILMSAPGTLGRTVVYDGVDAYFQDSNIVWLDNNEELVTNAFLFYIYQIVRYDSEGGTIQRLYNSIIESAKFCKPTLPEQQKIASYLSALDTKIESVAQQIAQTQQFKKGLLQQLFV